MGKIISLIKNKSANAKCPICDVISKFKISENMKFVNSIDGETYCFIHYTNCNHEVPVGLFEWNNGIPKITTFKELQEMYMEEYKETGNIEMLKKARNISKIVNGEVEL